MTFFSASTTTTTAKAGKEKYGPLPRLTTRVRCGEDALERRVRVNLNQIKRDATYVSFLAISCLGFASVAGTEVVSLSKTRAEASKAIRECSTMLDLNALDKINTMMMMMGEEEDTQQKRNNDDEEEKERTERRDGQTVLERTEVFTPNSVPDAHVSRVSTPFRAVFFTRHANAVDRESE